MNNITFRLLVLRTADTAGLAAFYSFLLGLTFDYHQHGSGPFHYAAEAGSVVLEIYPLAKGQLAGDKHLRLGFGIDQFDEVMAELPLRNIPFTPPVQTAFGLLCVVTDPDGRKIELYPNRQSI